MALIDRFQARDDLIEALLKQKFCFHDPKVAEAMAEEGELIEFSPGQNIIEQGASDRDVYFLLAGSGQIIINGVRLYKRASGETVGEMSAINSSIVRSATIEASEPTVAWKVTHNHFSKIGNTNPPFWRHVAHELAGRLEQRNQFITKINTRPKVFIICSAESLDIARAVRVGLEHYAQGEIWSDEQIFKPGGYPIEDLETILNQSDFGIALAEPDDLILSRDKKSATPRDNVIFELGFFMSKLGRYRTLLLVPRNEEIKLPSDFKGLTPISYMYDRTAAASGMGPAIDRIITIIQDLKVRASLIDTK